MTDLQIAKLLRLMFIVAALYAGFMYIFKKDPSPLILMSAGFTIGSIETTSRNRIKQLKEEENND